MKLCERRVEVHLVLYSSDIDFAGGKINSEDHSDAISRTDRTRGERRGDTG